MTGEDGLEFRRSGYCLEGSGAMCSEDMAPSFMCFLALCIIPVESFVIPLMWSEDIWSLDIASGFGAASWASATLPKAAEHRTKPSAAMPIFGLDAMKRYLP
jgi:hypothetical protein